MNCAGKAPPEAVPYLFAMNPSLFVGPFWLYD
jgi:hypothetical protein